MGIYMNLFIIHITAVNWWYRSAFYNDPSIPEGANNIYRMRLFSECGCVLNSTGYNYPYYQDSGGNYYVFDGGRMVG